MNQEIKVQWIEALNSGKYKQGVNVLRSKDDKYCCLGVLCDVLGEPWNVTSGIPNYYYCGEEQMRGSLCERIRVATGVSAANMKYLIDMNDDTKASFTEIAKYIEDNM